MVPPITSPSVIIFAPVTVSISLITVTGSENVKELFGKLVPIATPRPSSNFTRLSNSIVSPNLPIVITSSAETKYILKNDPRTRRHIAPRTFARVNISDPPYTTILQSFKDFSN